ncbi:MAG TPA: phosphoribosyltransferase [Candidatus Methanomethylia archaeon]|nr:phosphoribosyltransferase [Candidatus Methanomethylicia archaeon]
MPKVNCKLVSWDDVMKWCWELAEVIKGSGWMPDMIVAISRGGAVPARLLCDYLCVSDMMSIQVVHWPTAAEVSEKARVKYPLKLDLSGKKVLLVDDIADTGDSLILAKKTLEADCKPAEVKIATMQWISPVCKIKPEYYVDEVKEWIWYQYPWTRLEDIIDFIRRLFREGGKESWGLEEIAGAFPEWYGLSYEERWYKAAVEWLIKFGELEEVDGRYRATEKLR